MWIIQMSEWFGPGNKMRPDQTLTVEASTSLQMFYTTGDLEPALERLLQHQVAYNDHYSLAINFTFVSASKLDVALSPELLRSLRVQLVDYLQVTAAEFKN